MKSSADPYHIRSLKTPKLTPYGSLGHVLTGLPVPAFPAPNLSTEAHFSAADFFRDCPWLNVPVHRKADITIEPLYPRLGLLGGAPKDGKVSKLAALAAARNKNKDDTKAEAPSDPSSKPQQEQPQATPKLLGTSSLTERLTRDPKPPKPSEGGGGSRRLGKLGLSSSSSTQKKPQSEPPKAALKPEPVTIEQVAEEKKDDPNEDPEPREFVPNMRASPSMFASAIVGDAPKSKQTEPSHLHSKSVDLLGIYGQNHAEPFDFAGPSPDDVVLNAQNTAKGLAIRRKV